MNRSEKQQWTILDVLKWTTVYFGDHHIENPRIEAEILLAYALGLNRIDLYLKYDKPLEKRERQSFKHLIKRRVNSEPTAYITGSREFFSLDFYVNKHVLIPRPETECLVEEAVQAIDAMGPYPLHIMDMGTGSGAVITALAKERPHQIYIAMDRSEKAVRIAKKNARRHGVDLSISFFCADWLQPLKENKKGFDLIISNPPYVETDEIRRLQPEIRRFEPFNALDGGADGLDSLRRIIKSAHHYMKSGGRLALEIGAGQKKAIEMIAENESRYNDLVVRKDYSGIERVMVFKKR